ncbi:Histidine transport system permease protein HisM [Pseudomonas fluorescens]|uniref:Histidine/lysine/arginine/ornithine transport system permease protein HisM n=1 Tax=Pseudomonas fluorescens TaxID=294 RepID=A0A5E7SXN2_PSEFL|nr:MULTISPECIES: histidine ABC transporter permease HisM [Pseudomonas]OPA95532.1 amino acid ABC transporter permease [Pseudomonas fluorescens]OPB12857.1 amino acid ABC transporter permease [Pseudomonas fluorescens]OPB25257.1 amino acid ABC transporter permease [Pseudomonas fluorescens]RMU82882.1 hypothetical protein ALP22_200050 [Pseudomonas coronafaciens pv. porri]VVP91531.1 Histidine transport system permease protein HisM [Pseudomonas fluorescens]
MIELFTTYWQSFLWSDGQQWSGVAVTLMLLVASTVGGFVLSIPLALGRVSSSRMLSAAIWLYTYTFRTTPLYVQLLIIYSGLYSLSFIRDTPLVSDFFRDAYCCTLLAFILNECAYMTEILVGSIRASQRGEIEAAKAFGLSAATINFKVILPSALRRALPAYSNEVIFMLHGTTLAFTATVPDILKVARDVNSETYLTFTTYGLASLLYLMISLCIIASFHAAEKRWLKHLKPRKATKAAKPSAPTLKEGSFV